MTLKQIMRSKSYLILSAACLLLVLGVGSVSAQCDLGRCDRDGDGFPKNHKGKCVDCPLPVDCDDSVYNEDNVCNGGTSLAYTAELTGAFGFADVMNMFPASDGDELLSAETVYMLRSLDDDSLQAIWNNAFEACPELGGAPDGISANPDSWSIRLGSSHVRISLVDYAASVGVGGCGVEQGKPPCWELWIQLRSEEDLDDPSLPEVVGDQSVFSLSRVWIWGKPETKKGRKSDCDTSWVQLDTPSTLVITATAAQP